MENRNFDDTQNWFIVISLSVGNWILGGLTAAAAEKNGFICHSREVLGTPLEISIANTTCANLFYD